MRSNSSDSLEPSYTPQFHLFVAIALVALSILMFVFGIKPSSLEGARQANGFGWFCGAVCAPVLMTALLFVSVLLSVVHSFFWALERSF